MPIDPSYLHLVHPGPMPAFLYGRNSKDPTKKGGSVDDQVAVGMSLCERHSWPIAGVFRDVDESASRYRKRGQRDDFEAMLEGIRRRECRVVVAFEASRYYRNLETYVRLRAACIEADVLLCYDEQVYDLSKRADRKATARDALDAEDEADGIQERNARTARQNLADGHPNGPCLFGYRRRYDPDTGELVDQVAHKTNGPTVTEVFRRAAAVEAHRAIARDLKARGLDSPDPRGGPWRDHHVRMILRNPSYLGKRVHRGQPVTDGKWPPLTDETTWQAVQDLQSSTVRASTEEREIVHWQSGIGRCGPCDLRRVRTLFRAIPKKGSFRYVCTTTAHPDARFCVSITEEKLDAYVEEGLLAWLSSPALVAAFEPDAEDGVAVAAARAATLRRQLEEARALAGTIGLDGSPGLSVASLAALESNLTPQIAAAEEEAKPQVMPPSLERFRGVDDRVKADKVWAGLDITQRRAVLRAAVTVRLWPARAPGVRRIEPGRVTLAFVGQPGFVPLLRGRDGLPEGVSG